MAGRRQWRGWLAAVLALAATAPHGLAQQPAADVTEVRDFVVHVGGKQVGHNQLVITQRADGVISVANKAHVQVKVLGFTYTYSFQGSEVWHNHQLVKLDGQCDDNSKKHSVQADFDAKGNVIRVQAGGREQAIKPEVWTTSYWRLPEARFHNKAVVLLDADRGEVIGGQLQYVGTDELVIAGQKQKCYHFKVVGPNPPVDAWYDAYHRLVRQEFTDRGHRTVIELVGVKR
jgi:hypothetical protein